MPIEHSYSYLRVLVVDDYSQIRKTMVRLLTSSGFSNVFEAPDGQTAFSIINKNKIDLVLCDLHMPDSDGLELLNNIRSNTPKRDIPVIMVSGESERADIVKLNDAGAANYILKPFTPEDFISKIDDVLRAYFDPNQLSRLLNALEDSITQKEFIEAREHLKALQNSKPNHPSVIKLHAKLLAAENRLEEALQKLDLGINLNPLAHQLYAMKASILFELQRIDEGFEALEAELNLNPKQPEKQVLLGKHKIESNLLKGAIEHFRIALREDKKDKNALMGIADAFYKLGNINKTIHYLFRYRRKHPKDSKSLQKIIEYCEARGEQKKAEYALKTEINLNPKRFDTYLLLADFYNRHATAESAISIIKKLEEYDPNNIRGMILKAKILSEQNKLREAKQIYSYVSRRAPSLEILMTLAEINLKLGEQVDLYKICEKAILLGSENPGALYQLANSCLINSEPTKSYLIARKAMICGAKGKKIKQLANTAHKSIRKRRIAS